MKYTTAILVFIGTLAIALPGCRKSSAVEKAQAEKADTVAVFILKKEIFNKELSFPGELLPLERAEIYAKVAGYVNSIRVDIGDRVKKGELMVVLDAPELIAGYAQANSEMQAARSKYSESLDSYRRILNASRTEGTVATGELERARNRMTADSAAYEAARSKLSADAQLKDYLNIRSPFSGVVTGRNIDPGTLVGNMNSKPLLTIENNSALRLRLAVPETYTSANSNVSAVHFTVDAYPGVIYEARLSRKAGALNTLNRTETWEFIYDNADNQLKSGMFATASLKFGRAAPTFIVPPSAIVTNLERRFVIRLRNGKADLTDVRNGAAVDNRTEIFGNLTEGDTLLVRGTDEIRQGKKLIPKFQSR